MSEMTKQIRERIEDLEAAMRRGDRDAQMGWIRSALICITNSIASLEREIQSKSDPNGECCGAMNYAISDGFIDKTPKGYRFYGMGAVPGACDMPVMDISVCPFCGTGLK